VLQARRVRAVAALRGGVGGRVRGPGHCRCFARGGCGSDTSSGRSGGSGRKGGCRRQGVIHAAMTRACALGCLRGGVRPVLALERRARRRGAAGGGTRYRARSSAHRVIDTAMARAGAGGRLRRRV